MSGVGPVDQTEFAAASEFDANASVADDEFPSIEEAAMLSRGIRTSVTKNATGLIKLFEFILTVIKQHYQGSDLLAGSKLCSWGKNPVICRRYQFVYFCKYNKGA